MRAAERRRAGRVHGHRSDEPSRWPGSVDVAVGSLCRDRLDVRRMRHASVAQVRGVCGGDNGGSPRDGDDHAYAKWCRASRRTTEGAPLSSRPSGAPPAASGAQPPAAASVSPCSRLERSPRSRCRSARWSPTSCSRSAGSEASTTRHRRALDRRRRRMDASAAGPPAEPGARVIGRAGRHRGGRSPELAARRLRRLSVPIETAAYRLHAQSRPARPPAVARLEDLPLGGSTRPATPPHPPRCTRPHARAGVGHATPTHSGDRLGVAIALPLLVAGSRLYRGMHHPLDVAGGALVGLGTLAIALFASRAAEAARRDRAS